MDAKERKDTINETALAVVEAQQTVVGAGVLGAGVATLNTTTDKNSGILEQIRDFSEKSLTSIRKAVTVFTELLTFDKEQARLVREQSAEKAKEDFIGPKLPSKTGDATIGDVLAVHTKGPVVKDRITQELVKLPDERRGILMVFRTFEKVSYGLILRTEAPLKVGDVVKNPS